MKISELIKDLSAYDLDSEISISVIDGDILSIAGIGYKNPQEIFIIAVKE